MWLFGIMFAIGLCLAGSEGEWFPWINLLGVAMVGLVGVALYQDLD